MIADLVIMTWRLLPRVSAVNADLGCGSHRHGSARLHTELSGSNKIGHLAH
jgi:hypothetical protein